MIRVALDVQIADVSQAGIGQFTAQLQDALRQRSDLEVISLRPKGKPRQLAIPQRFWWDQVVLPPLLRKTKVDVFLKSGFSVPVRSAVPTVAVLHDLAARRFPSQLHLPSAWFYGKFMPWSLRFAARTVTISDFTRSEARALLHLPADRLVTVIQGGDELASPQSDANDDAIVAHFVPAGKYILHIGTVEPRKNLAFLVRAFTRFAAIHKDFNLLLVGKAGWQSSDVDAAIRSSGMAERIRRTGSVTDVEKRALLRKAALLAFPSLYEGFGLPPLEAMRSGTPVVASHAAAIKEIVGDAGILLEQYDEQAWAGAMSRVVDDQSVRANLRQRGIARARQFSWSAAAETFAKILHEAAHDSPS